MVKFSREYEASLIPEWKGAFVDYKCLKKVIKKIKIARRRDGDYDDESPSTALSGEDSDKHEREFLEMAEEELEKVNGFYVAQEAELLGRGEALIDQLRILADVKRVLADHAASRRSRSISALGGSGLASPQSTSGGRRELQQAQMMEGAAVADDVMAELERNGVSFVGLSGKKEGVPVAGAPARCRPSTVRIDIPATNPGWTALKMWEDLVNVLRKDDGADPAAAVFVHRKKIQHAEKNIRDAFMALYRGLELLKKFSSLNVKAFTKILKKFVKVSEQQQQATDLFSQKVKRSLFSTSDKVLRLADEVESLFMKHFAANDKTVAMKYLKPQQRRSRHMVTFLVGA